MQQPHEGREQAMRYKYRARGGHEESKGRKQMTKQTMGTPRPRSGTSEWRAREATQQKERENTTKPAIGGNKGVCKRVCRT